MAKQRYLVDLGMVEILRQMFRDEISDETAVRARHPVQIHVGGVLGRSVEPLPKVLSISFKP